MRKLAQKRISNTALFISTLLALPTGIFLGVIISKTLPHEEWGSATPIVINGEPTPVFKLTVSEKADLPLFSSPTASAAADVHTPAFGRYTADQLENRRLGREAACDLATTLSLPGYEDATECQRRTSSLQVDENGRTTGASSGLAHALAVVSTMGDFFGDLTVAATGQINAVKTPQGSSFAVTMIGGEQFKAEAAMVAKADVVVVPRGNEGAFAASGYTRTPGDESDNHPDLVPVYDLHEALVWLCVHSQTKDCQTYVLPLE